MVDWSKLAHRRFEDVHQTYTTRETMLYALGLGVGLDLEDAAQQNFVYEVGLLALPSMATVLGHPGFWLSEFDLGLDWQNVLHLDQELSIIRPLAPEGYIIGRTTIEGCYDRGEGRGIYLDQRREVFDGTNNTLLAVLRSRKLCRGSGGYGGPPPPLGSHVSIPVSSPDFTAVFATSAQSALIYRLSGDSNPLHVDPHVARQAGFERPILHGLCTFGALTYHLLRWFCEAQPPRLKSIRMHFSAPVYPSDALRVQAWQTAAEQVRFQAYVLDSGVLVIDGGQMDYDLV